MNDMLKATEDVARTLGVQLQLIEMRGAEELERAFSAMMQKRAEALFLFESDALPCTTTHRRACRNPPAAVHVPRAGVC
jgi:DNA-binding LacI/PurR family transcriptional regulator